MHFLDAGIRGFSRRACVAPGVVRSDVSPGRRVREDEAQSFTRRLAQAVLEGYSLRDARLELLRHDFVQVFRVVSPGGEVLALRLYRMPRAEPPRSDARASTGFALRSPQTLRQQLAWLSALRRETGLLVPEPVPAADGSLVGRVSVEGAPEVRHYALLRWVSGRHKGEDLTPADLSLVGSFMAWMHDHAERHRAGEEDALPRWDWHWPFGDSAPLWSAGEIFYSAEQIGVFEEVARSVWQDLQELGYGRDVFGPIHRDLNLRNIVFQNGTVGAIDFDLCGLGHYLLDLVVTMTVTPLQPRREDDIERMREALLEGYRSERSLPENYRKYLKTFNAMRRVAVINRRIELLSSPATRHEARGGHRFLQNSLTWLRRNYL